MTGNSLMPRRPNLSSSSRDQGLCLRISRVRVRARGEREGEGVDGDGWMDEWGIPSLEGVVVVVIVAVVVWWVVVGYQRSVGKVTLAGWPSLAPSQSLPDRAHPPCKPDKETWLGTDSQPDSHIYLAAYVVSTYDTCTYSHRQPDGQNKDSVIVAWSTGSGNRNAFSSPQTEIQCNSKFCAFPRLRNQFLGSAHQRR